MRSEVCSSIHILSCQLNIENIFVVLIVIQYCHPINRIVDHIQIYWFVPSVYTKI